MRNPQDRLEKALKGRTWGRNREGKQRVTGNGKWVSSFAAKTMLQPMMQVKAWKPIGTQGVLKGRGYKIE